MLVNLDARYQINSQLQMFLRVNNALDRKFENFGILGENFFPGGV